GRFGLRPMPHFLGFTRNTPKPRSSIRSPRVSAWRSASMIVSTACAAFWRPTPAASVAALMMSFLITWGSVGVQWELRGPLTRTDQWPRHLPRALQVLRPLTCYGLNETPSPPPSDLEGPVVS